MNALAISCANLFADVRYALRSLRTAPGYAATAVLTLALGLGAATAMLAVVDSVLLRPVPLPHPEQLVNIVRSDKWGDQGDFTFRQLDIMKRQVSGFSQLLEFTSLPKPVRTADSVRMNLTVETSPNYFRALEVSAYLGRTYTESDKNANVAVISNAFWRDTLHNQPNVIGSKVTLYGRVFTIIGVMPARFYFPPQTFDAPAVAVPFWLDAKGQDYNGFEGTQAMARLQKGVTLSAAQQQLRAVFNRNKWGQDDDARVSLRGYRSTVTNQERPALLSLLGACIVLLLIACANTANLQVVRGAGRSAEMNLRAALGAGRRRLLQMVTVESLALSLVGGGCGLVLALAILEWTRKTYGIQYARFNELAVHPSVFLACLALAVVTGLFAALAPALSAVRAAGHRSATLGTRTVSRLRVSSPLIVSEIALTCVLLVTAGLFLRTFRALETAPLGFDPKEVTSVVLMSESPSPSGPAAKATDERVLNRLASIPGIQAVASQTSVPFSTFNLSLNSTFSLSGHTLPKNATVAVSLISSGYRRAMNISMLQGRSFSRNDTEGSAGVCVVNEAFVRKYLAGRTPLGDALHFTSNDPKDPHDRFLQMPLTIVGVAPDEVSQGIAVGADPTVFVDAQQVPADNEAGPLVFGFAPQFVVRSTLPQAALEQDIRQVLKTEAPGLAEMSIQSIHDAMQRSLSERILALRLASLFGLAALLLAAVGIYGVLAYSVAQRTREIGIRIALGSSRANTVGLILQQVGLMAFFGIAIGTGAAWPAGRAVKSFLFGVQPLDPVSLLLTASLVLIVCAAAAVIPAWRAAQVEPLEALRTE